MRWPCVANRFRLRRYPQETAICTILSDTQIDVPRGTPAAEGRRSGALLHDFHPDVCRLICGCSPSSRRSKSRRLRVARAVWLRAGMGMFLACACRSMSSSPLWLCCAFRHSVSLGLVITAWPVPAGPSGRSGCSRVIAEVLGPVVVVGAAVDILGLLRFTSALFNVKPPPLFMGILAGEPARMFAESTRFGSVLLPW